MRIRRKHDLGAGEVRRRVDELAADLCRRFSLRSEWRGNHLRISGSGANGRIEIEDHAIEVDVELGFGLKLMEGTIRRAVEDAMDEHLV